MDEHGWCSLFRQQRVCVCERARSERLGRNADDGHSSLSRKSDLLQFVRHVNNDLTSSLSTRAQLVHVQREGRDCIGAARREREDKLPCCTAIFLSTISSLFLFFTIVFWQAKRRNDNNLRIISSNLDMRICLQNNEPFSIDVDICERRPFDS